MSASGVSRHEGFTVLLRGKGEKGTKGLITQPNPSHSILAQALAQRACDLVTSDVAR